MSTTQPTCTVPPAGWQCSRTAGHEGPCAASPVVLITADLVTEEEVENLIYRASKAYAGPYRVELMGDRSRFFIVNGGQHVLRRLMSEFELNDYTAEHAERARATDAYMAAADPLTIAKLAKEVLQLRTALNVMTERRNYGADIINDMKLEAEQYEARIEKLQKEVLRLTDETLHLKFKDGSPAANNS